MDIDEDFVLARRQGARMRWKRMFQVRGISNEEMMEFLGVSLSTLNRWATPHHSVPDVLQLAMVCDRWNISANWLIFGIGPMSMQDAGILDQKIEYTQVWDRRMARIDESLLAILDRLPSCGDA